MLGQEHTTVQVEAEATHMPTEIEVSVEGLDVGAHITAGDLSCRPASTLVTDAETLLLNVIAAPTAEEIEADTAASIAELGIVEEPATDEAETRPVERVRRRRGRRGVAERHHRRRPAWLCGAGSAPHYPRPGLP